MPELPEVETLRRGLIPIMDGSYILSVTTNRPDLRFPFPDNFVSRLIGRKIIGISRRGKYLLFDLDDGNVLVIHLGMSGSLRINDSGSPNDSRYHGHSRDSAHDHVIFGLGSSSSKRKVGLYIIYNDPRRFGYMDIVERAMISDHRFFVTLGIEPLGNEFTSENLALCFRGVRSNLKPALLDQRHIAGLGNIYVCEALWRSCLSPRRRACSLVARSGSPTSRLTSLVTHIRSVLNDALDSGGSSLRDHADADGTLGYFQHEFGVYDREGLPCFHNDCSGLVRRIIQSGRSTFYCSGCQR